MKHDQNKIEHKVYQYIKKNKLISGGDTVVVALSGGPDSICLFDILFNLQPKIVFSLSACHYNHRLRGEESEADQKYVEDMCSERGVELFTACRSKTETIKNEEDARILRYRFFEKISKEKGSRGVKIGLAHNLNDLAETLLQRLIRGSGLRGLSSILPQRKFYIRPLLQISRPEILEYLESHHLAYRTDSSNLDNKYQRNKIRNLLIPDMLKYNPSLVEALARSATSLAEDMAVIDEYVAEKLRKIVKIDGKTYTIPVKEYHLLGSGLRKNILRECLEQIENSNDISFQQINKIDEIVMANIGEKKLPLPHSLRFEIKRGMIYLYQQQF